MEKEVMPRPRRKFENRASKFKILWWAASVAGRWFLAEAASNEQPETKKWKENCYA